MYILHQGVIVVLGYWIVNLALPMFVRFGLLLATSIVVTAAIYVVVVRPIPLVRLAFGMKAARTTAIAAADRM